MNWGRRSRTSGHVCRWFRLGLPFWVASVAMGQELTVVNQAEPVSESRLLDASTTQVIVLGEIPCSTAGECDDGNACTTDACITDVCSNEPILGCVACAPGYECPPLDVVFVMDTSGSMRDEAAMLCDSFETLQSQMLSLGVNVNVSLLGITETDPSFSCLSDNVAALHGEQAPCATETCPLTGDFSSAESWGTATAIVAERFAWEAGSFRVIVPVSDESPCGGDLPEGCNDPGTDRDSIDNAINVALRHGVIVSPILTSGFGVCAATLAADLADATGGTTLHTSKLASGELIEAIIGQLLSLCRIDERCDDGDACTCGDVCVAGRCAGTTIAGCKPCNASGICGDSNLCTIDECIGLECISTPNYDTERFICDPATGDLTPIELVDDGNPCTELVLDPCTGEPMQVPVLDRTPCEDGLYCTEGDYCLAGVCVGGIEPCCQHLDDQCSVGICDEDQDVCVASPIRENEPCDDGDVCIVGETCQNAVCGGGSEPTCDDTGNDCTAIVCDPLGAQGNCDLLVNINEDGPCADGNACTTGDYCVQGVCISGGPLTCDDQNLCTDDSCDPATGCTYANNSNPCDDGNACTTGDSCVEGTCTVGPPLACDDGNVCTDDSCDPASGCVYTNNADPCDDGDACTLDDACVAGECVVGPPPDCNDNNLCTDDSCLPDSGCFHVNNALPCSDGDACTEGDACIRGACEGGDPRDCDDDNECTDDACFPQIGCVYENITEPCDDGTACTDGDVCVEGVCVSGADVDCDDGNTCTTEYCDPVDGCIYENNTGDCDDGSVCTTADGCSDGQCVGGAAINCDDGNVCTDDSCDPVDGCIHEYDTAPCDDGNTCTVLDTCDGNGECVGTALNTILCDLDSECFGRICNPKTGYCLCNEVPELCLEAEPTPLLAADCYSPDEDIRVNVVLRPSIQLVSGGQFFISYDPAAFEFLSVVAGVVTDPQSPFVLMLLSPIVDQEAGTVFLAVGTDYLPPSSATYGPAIMASLTFRPIATCISPEPFCFLDENPYTTGLIGAEGQAIPYVPCCLEDLFIGASVPAQIHCPERIIVNADAGGLSASLTWDAPIGTGGCSGNPRISCTGENEYGVPVDHLAMEGGIVPPGETTFECTATDECGVSTTCGWSVFVTPLNTLEVTVSFSPPIADGPLQRCIEFEIFSSCIEAPITFAETLTFGWPLNLPGQAKSVFIKIPAGKYACMTARDPLHTLRSTAFLSIVDNHFAGEFRGDPVFSGNWLRGGNLNQDRVIDIFDLAVYSTQAGMILDPNTPCGTVGPHSDVNGDGIVDTFDLSFIDRHFSEHDKETCCPSGTSPATAPMNEISVGELERMGLGELISADLNGDGMVNHADLIALRRGVRPATVKQNRRRSFRD